MPEAQSKLVGQASPTSPVSPRTLSGIEQLPRLPGTEELGNSSWNHMSPPQIPSSAGGRLLETSMLDLFPLSVGVAPTARRRPLVNSALTYRALHPVEELECPAADPLIPKRRELPECLATSDEASADAEAPESTARDQAGPRGLKACELSLLRGRRLSLRRHRFKGQPTVVPP